MGAEIIKIEHPKKQDYLRNAPPYKAGKSAAFEMLNRGKRGLALDVTVPEGRAVFMDLIKTADLVLEGFRPGVLAKAGIDYAEAQKVNERVIYVSITGYGQDGPYAQKAGHDLNYIGYAGILGATGKKETGPIPPGVQIGDVAGGGYMAVIGALSALQARQTSGRGQHVDISMLDGCIPLLSLQLAHEWAGGVPNRRGEAMLSGGAPNYSVYRCADGLFVALGALEPKFWDAFCAWVARPDWRGQQYADGEAGKKLLNELAELFATKPRDEWIQQLKDRDICLSPVLELDELAQDPQLQHRGMIYNEEGEQLPRIGMPIKFSATKTSDMQRNAPELGAESIAILREAGIDEARIKRMQEKGIIEQSP